MPKPESFDGRVAHSFALTLLRVGFAEPFRSPGTLVRSYRTLSTFPVIGCRSVRSIGGLLSVALSCESPRLAVSQHSTLWSPDFPQPVLTYMPRPPGQLIVGTSLPCAVGSTHTARLDSRTEEFLCTLRPILTVSRQTGDVNETADTVTRESTAATESASVEERSPLGRAAAATFGLIAAALGLAVGEFFSGLSGGVSPVVAVGNRVVDSVPRPVKEFAIDTFGKNDKIALLAGIMILTALYAIYTGLVARKSISQALVAIAAFVVVGLVCAVSGRVFDAVDLLPTLVAGITVAAMVWVVFAQKPESALQDPTRGRRRFLLLGLGGVGVAAGASWTGRKFQTDIKSTESRAAVSIPKPKTTTPATVPKSFGVEGLPPFVTPIGEFYRIDTALVVPRLNTTDWKLEITGMVDKPMTLRFEDLLKRETIEHECTLMCVSNEIGGGLIGNAVWTGVRLADILREAGVQEGANQVFLTSADGWTAGFPTEAALDGREALIAFGMNGEPLPFQHGFPARLVIPGIYGYVSAVKWVTEIKLTTFEADQGYWIPRGWSTLGPIKTGSRIDVPRRGTAVKAGRTAIAGIAWAQHRGITRVEVQVDDNEWQEAELSDAGTIDTWRQWKVAWDAEVGVHNIRVRATDSDGITQTQMRAPIAPDGATGWHTISVDVSESGGGPASPRGVADGDPFRERRP